MGKLRHYSFIDNPLPDVPFFAEARERENIESLYRRSEKKNTRSRSSFPYRAPLSSLAIWSGMEGRGRKKESLFKVLRGWKDVLGKKKQQPNSDCVEILVFQVCDTMLLMYHFD